MQGWNRQTLIFMLALLVFLPLGVESWQRGRALRQDRRDDELVARYDASPDPVTHKIDFDGDGIDEFMQAERLPGLSERWLTVANGEGRVLLRLPFNYADNTFRTHIALVTEAGLPHLLVYDGANYHEPLRAVYAFDGRGLAPIPATSRERAILSAMAAHDDTGGWNERAVRGVYSACKLVCYYFALAVIIFVVAYRRFTASSGHAGYHLLRSQP